MAIPAHVQRKLEQALGQEAAEDLVTWMESVDENRADIAELRHEMQVGFARMETRFAGLEGMIERRSADLMRWSFVFWVGAVTSIALLAKLLR